MKKLQHKLRRKKPAPKEVTRITNETVAEHRERVLAGGRKFKYPRQYLRHRLVINASIVGVLAVILLVALGWWQLYIVQNTSNFLYRVTRVIPVPVASVDGTSVRYSDYLMRYRSQELWLRNQGQLGISQDDEQRQLDFYKRRVMDAVQFDVYAATRAESLSISVSEADIDAVIDANRNTSTGRISQDVYNSSTRATLGYSPDEYRYIIKQSLLRQRAAYAVDETAKASMELISERIEGNDDVDLKSLAEALEKDDISVEFGASGLVPKNNQDSGRAQAAAKLQNGQVSDPIQSVNVDEYGYYFVQRIDGNETQVNYQYIRVPLTTLQADFAALKEKGAIDEYISLDEVEQRRQDE